MKKTSSISGNKIHYEKLVQRALLSGVKGLLSEVAQNGGVLPGDHHFFITFKTHAKGVVIPEYLKTKYPDCMTIVLQHEFYDLTVTEDMFSVGLSFSNNLEKLEIPFSAVLSFSDPSVQFGLNFLEDGETSGQSDERNAASGTKSPSGRNEQSESAEILDFSAFKKKM